MLAIFSLTSSKKFFKYIAILKQESKPQQEHQSDGVNYFFCYEKFSDLLIDNIIL